MLSKKIPDKPRYSRTLKIAQNFILEQNIDKLPVDPFNLAAKIDLPIVSASEYATIMNCSFQHVIRDIIKSNDGSTKYVNGIHFILYNERVSSKGRIRWTLLHEIGHVRLGHLSDFKETRIQRAGLTKSEYDVLEKEADYFASHILAPPIILEALKVNSVTRLMTICGLSKLASENRYKDYMNNLKRVKFPSFLELKVERIFYDFIHKKRCPRCGHGFISKNAIYCPICRRKIIWGEGKMIYEGFRLDKNNKALVCPRCGDEEPHDQGDYCPICGVYLINKCDDIMDSNGHGNVWIEKAGCGTLAAGNARFCIHCGNPTTFYHANLLKDWDEVQKNQMGEMLSEAASTEDDNEAPF